MKPSVSVAAVAALLAAMAVAGSAGSYSTSPRPSSTFLVGVDDDHVKWLARPDGLVAKYRDLGLEGVQDEADRSAILSNALAQWGVTD